MLFFAARDRNHRALLAFLLGTLAVGAVGSVFITPNIEGWYARLAKPDFVPPDYVFAPVWTALYILMAFAAWRVWKLGPTAPACGEGRKGLNTALALYFIQLALNLGWSLIFFGLHRPGLAFAEILGLFAAVAATGFAFRRIDKLAGMMFTPYVTWVGFAGTLNYEIWMLNP